MTGEVMVEAGDAIEVGVELLGTQVGGEDFVVRGGQDVDADRGGEQLAGTGGSGQASTAALKRRVSLVITSRRPGSLRAKPIER